MKSSYSPRSTAHVEKTYEWILCPEESLLEAAVETTSINAQQKYLLRKANEERHAGTSISRMNELLRVHGERMHG